MLKRTNHEAGVLAVAALTILVTALAPISASAQDTPNAVVQAYPTQHGEFQVVRSRTETLQSPPVAIERITDEHRAQYLFESLQTPAGIEHFDNAPVIGIVDVASETLILTPKMIYRYIGVSGKPGAIADVGTVTFEECAAEFSHRDGNTVVVGADGGVTAGGGGLAALFTPVMFSGRTFEVENVFGAMEHYFEIVNKRGNFSGLVQARKAKEDSHRAFSWHQYRFSEKPHGVGCITSFSDASPITIFLEDVVMKFSPGTSFTDIEVRKQGPNHTFNWRRVGSIARSLEERFACSIELCVPRSVHKRVAGADDLMWLHEIPIVVTRADGECATVRFVPSSVRASDEVFLIGEGFMTVENVLALPATDFWSLIGIERLPRPTLPRSEKKATIRASGGE